LNEGEELAKEQAAKLGAKVLGVTLLFGTMLCYIWQKQKKIDSINQEIKQLDAVLNFFDRLRDERNTNSQSKPSQLETDIERKNLIPSSPGS